jgi:DNA-binding protein Fis
VLRERNGNVTHAAEALGISRVALQKKMKEYGLR